MPAPATEIAALWSYGLATVTYLVLSSHLARRWKTAERGVVERWLLIATLASSGWAGAAALMVVWPLAPFAGLRDIADTVRYGAWFGFALHLLYRPASAAAGGLPRTPFGAVAAAIVVLALILRMAQAAGWHTDIAGGAAYPYLSLAQVIFGAFLLEQMFRNTTADTRWNIKPLGVALAAMLAFDLYFFSMALLFNRADDEAYAVRGFAHALVAPLIVLTLQRARARKLKVELSKSATFQTASLVVAGLYLLAASAAGYYVRYAGGSWGGALQLAFLFAALVILLLLLLSGSLRARLRVFIGKHFLRYRYDYREEWLKFTRALSSTNDSQQIGPQVVRGLADMVESPAGALWLLDAEGRDYRQRARWNLPESDAQEASDSALMHFLAASGWVLNLEEYRHMPGRYRDLQLPDWLAAMPNAWLIVPLATAKGAIGFVVLATARTPLDVNWEVNDLLRTAGQQAAAFLAQIQASEALLEARKFDAFNRMSAFVVHDLKNIVTQLSLMLKNAERHADNVEFQRDMLATVSHSVDRMKQLMLQLREGTPSAAGACGIELGEIARRVCAAKATQAPAVTLTVKDKVMARGHEERIERVIGHLVQNALDATPGDGRIWLTVSRQAQMALIEVGDSGRGMSATFVRDQLFRPFKTTKQAGMGIGAYESQQYIRELGGDIRVESTENAGTRFFIKLPLLANAPATADTL